MTGNVHTVALFIPRGSRDGLLTKNIKHTIKNCRKINYQRDKTLRNITDTSGMAGIRYAVYPFSRDFRCLRLPIGRHTTKILKERNNWTNELSK